MIVRWIVDKRECLCSFTTEKHHFSPFEHCSEAFTKADIDRTSRLTIKILLPEKMKFKSIASSPIIFRDFDGRNKFESTSKNLRNFLQ